MLLTITTTHQPATDLGFLLHKNPENLHSVSMTFGKAHIFYPEASAERCTAALMLDIDPVGLVHKTRGNEHFSLQQYVNDRPYVASSFLSVALNKAFRSALAGQSKHRKELVETEIPLEVSIPVLPCRGGEITLKKLFQPLGYEVEAQRLSLDDHFPEWGPSTYYSVALKRNCTLREFLSHLYVLIPVLDNDKHYYITDDEIEKLLNHGKGWLDSHPEKQMVTRRYLKYRGLADEALARLSDVGGVIPENEETIDSKDEEILEEKANLNERRIQAVIGTLRACKAQRVIDLGCGEGKLVKELLADPYFELVTGCDVAMRALERAQARLKMNRLPSMQRKRLSLMQSSLVYRDQRLAGFDAATVIEVIEHLDLSKLEAFRRVIFEFARPRVAIVTTPNAEYNVVFENLPKNKLRHSDHRFEWTRTEFEAWARETASRFGYDVRFEPIGEVHEIHGAPTQMGVFIRNE